MTESIIDFAKEKLMSVHSISKSDKPLSRSSSPSSSGTTSPVNKSEKLDSRRENSSPKSDPERSSKSLDTKDVENFRRNSYRDDEREREKNREREKEKDS